MNTLVIIIALYVGAKVEIDSLLTLNAQGMLRKNEINSLKQYKAHVDRVLSNYDHNFNPKGWYLSYTYQSH